jgi:hypothetical protein
MAKYEDMMRKHRSRPHDTAPIMSRLQKEQYNNIIKKTWHVLKHSLIYQSGALDNRHQFHILCAILFICTRHNQIWRQQNKPASHHSINYLVPRVFIISILGLLAYSLGLLVLVLSQHLGSFFVNNWSFSMK